MYCNKCGAQLDDHAKFCFGCGAQVGAGAAATPNPQPSYEAPVAPKKAPKKKKKGLVAVVAIIAVVAVAAAALVFSGLMGGDTVKVAAALAKSGKAFTNAADKLELTDVSALMEDEKISEEVSMWIDEIYGDTTFSGLGYRMAVDSDLPNRNIDMVLTPVWGSVDLLNIQMKMNDAEFYLGSPELTGGEFYMVNTETIFQDLANMGADLGDATSLRFNIFDIADQIKQMNAGNEEWTKAIQEAGTALLAEVEVSKVGSEEIDVNGAALNSTAYGVMVPETALHTFLDTIADAYSHVDYTTVYMEMLESMGFPAYILDEMEAAMADPSASVEEVFSVIHVALEELGDIQLNLYIHDGYVVSVVYESTIDGVDAMIALDIGGGTNYVDNIGLEVMVDHEGYRITSTGNHAGTGDAFTDVTILEYVYDGTVTPLVQMDSSYAPKQVEDNFSFLLKSDGAALELQGNLTCGQDFMNLYLHEISISEYDEVFAVLGMEFSISKYEGESISVDHSHAFADMTESDLMTALEEVTGYATNWAMNLDSDIQNKIMEIAYNFI